MTSSEFLEKHAITLISDNSGLPIVILKMQEDETKQCPFVTPKGCGIYKDRPWSCRMYPLDYDPEDDSYHFVVNASTCLGFNEEKQWIIEDYQADQGVLYPREVDRLFNEVLSRLEFPKDKIENPKITDMFYLAGYDIDAFRRFVFESRFLKVFAIDEKTIEIIKTDDNELARLAFLWLKFGMADKNALKIQPEAIQEK